MPTLIAALTRIGQRQRLGIRVLSQESLIPNMNPLPAMERERNRKKREPKRERECQFHPYTFKGRREISPSIYT